MSARFAHANIVASDFEALAAFYQQVFGCERLEPVRDLSAPWLARATGVPNARLRGVHLRLPGHGATGPTLEIFQYEPALERAPAAANRPGLGHLAFEVDDVSAHRRAVVAAGGHDLGETVTASIEGAGPITFVYLTDPEGNIIELQRWDR